MSKNLSGFLIGSTFTNPLGLTPTNIKIDHYTAVASDLVRCNSTTKTFNITLPENPTDGAMIGIMDVNGTFGTHAVTLLPGSGKTVEGDATSLVLDMTNTFVELVYNIITTNWRLRQTPVGILGDTSTTGTQTLTNKTLTSPIITTPTITGTKEIKVAVSANDINVASGNYFTKTISGSTTLTVSNVPTTGTAVSFILELTNGGSSIVSWWSGIKWTGGTVPTLTSAGRDSIGFYTYDGGTTWTGLVMGKDIK